MAMAGFARLMVRVAVSDALLQLLRGGVFRRIAAAVFVRPLRACLRALVAAILAVAEQVT